MNSKATIQDIAKLAGVGTGTVSRVLNNHPNVSQATRDKVIAAMKELNYRPSFAARHMRLQSSKIVGFLADEVITTPHAVDIIRGAQAVAMDHHMILSVYNTEPDREVTTSLIEMMLERGVQGIVYAAMWHHEITVPEKILEVPTILVNCFSDIGLPAIVPDEVDGGYNATKYLIDRGHRRIGFINLEPGIPATIGRLEGYKNALYVADIPFDDALVRGSENESERGYQETRYLMQLDDPVTAIFAGTDKIAVGVYDALKELGYSIPDDISVIGFDNQELITTSLRPALTSVQLPHYEMGELAMEHLIHLQDEGYHLETDKVLVPCPVVERASV